MLWWSDDLLTGIESIDNQHKSIFEKANDIFDLGTKSNWGDVEKVFIFLMNYAIEHFYEEERVMVEYSYDKFIEHRTEHNHFVEELYKLYSDMRVEITEEHLNSLKALIIEWLASHINIDDKKFIETMK